ncbi:MAG: nuclear transport factor 2 family protein, partial [Vitreimonas sp.]
CDMAANVSRKSLLLMIGSAPALLALAACKSADVAGVQPNEERELSTRAVVNAYFEALRSGGDWQAWLADDMAFTIYTSLVREVGGKQGYIEATRNFYSSIQTMQLRHVLVEGDRACAQTRYQLQPPSPSPAFTSDVAEIFTVQDGKIASFAIYFDTAPYPR